LGVPGGVLERQEAGPANVGGAQELDELPAALVGAPHLHLAREGVTRSCGDGHGHGGDAGAGRGQGLERVHHLVGGGVELRVAHLQEVERGDQQDAGEKGASEARARYGAGVRLHGGYLLGHAAARATGSGLVAPRGLRRNTKQAAGRSVRDTVPTETTVNAMSDPRVRTGTNWLTIMAAKPAPRVRAVNRMERPELISARAMASSGTRPLRRSSM